MLKKLGRALALLHFVKHRWMISFYLFVSLSLLPRKTEGEGPSKETDAGTQIIFCPFGFIMNINIALQSF